MFLGQRVNRHTEPSGPLAGHVRDGRRFSPPLAATGRLRVGDWVRDDLPDLLWPVAALSELGTSGARNFVRWQGAVQHDLAGEVEPQLLAEGLDGRLTSLDRLVADAPGAESAIRDRAREHGLLPVRVLRALASYPERPATWLIGSEFSPADQAVVEFLAEAIAEVLRDGHREAVIKCLPIWSAVQAGTFRTDAETIELLRNYPNDTSTRSKADSVVRASWGAQKGAQLAKDESRFDESVAWAKVFWGVNSMTTRCLRRREIDNRSGNGQESNSGTEPSAVPEGSEPLRQIAMDLVSSYVEALETSPARLYDQEPQEVHAGLVTRAGTEVITALGAPDLWCMEYGAHVVRTLTEARIYLQWMALQEPSIYREYQEYGRGKAKLYASIAEEIPTKWTNPGVKDAIDEFERLSYNHDVLDHRVVDTRDSFAGGKSLRAMAEEAGLLDLYRHAYYVASGITHSEWWSIETHCMERCLNVLHRGHLIPSLSLSSGANVELARSWIDSLYALMRLSLDVIGTDHEAVTSAFSWLSDEDEQEADG